MNEIKEDSVMRMCDLMVRVGEFKDKNGFKNFSREEAMEVPGVFAVGQCDNEFATVVLGIPPALQMYLITAMIKNEQIKDLLFDTVAKYKLVESFIEVFKRQGNKDLADLLLDILKNKK